MRHGHNECIKLVPTSGSLETMKADDILKQLSTYVRRWKRAAFEHGDESKVALRLKQDYEEAKNAYVKAREKEIGFKSGD